MQDMTEVTDCTPFHNKTVQRADFKLTHSLSAIAELLQRILLRKNSPLARYTEEIAERCQRTQIF
jgi:hypothetical protein